MHLLRKPSRLRYGSEVEAYHGEQMQVDSTTTVMESCGTCHNLAETHSHVSMNAGAGVGITGPGGSASITLDKGDKATLGGTFGEGLVVHSSVTYNPNPGPHVVVASPRSPGVTLSGGGTETYSTAVDNTRVGR